MQHLARESSFTDDLHGQMALPLLGRMIKISSLCIIHMCIGIAYRRSKLDGPMYRFLVGLDSEIFVRYFFILRNSHLLVGFKSFRNNFPISAYEAEDEKLLPSSRGQVSWVGYQPSQHQTAVKSNYLSNTIWLPCNLALLNIYRTLGVITSTGIAK